MDNTTYRNCLSLGVDLRVVVHPSRRCVWGCFTLHSPIHYAPQLPMEVNADQIGSKTIENLTPFVKQVIWVSNHRGTLVQDG